MTTSCHCPRRRWRYCAACIPSPGTGSYVFPSLRTGERPMSENTINAALRGMGYSKEVHTAHGFRAMARTIMDEVLGERVDLIEHQLAHAVKDPNGRAYNRTAHLPARRVMMQTLGELSGQIAHRRRRDSVAHRDAMTVFTSRRPIPTTRFPDGLGWHSIRGDRDA